MQLDPFDLVQGFGCQVAFSAVRTRDDRDIFNHQQIGSLAVASGHEPDLSAIATDLAAHCF